MTENDAPLQHSNDGGTTANIMLPVDQNDLADFLNKLLGQNQKISKSTFGLLDVDLDWLCNLNTLLEQRIFRQHNAVLLQFSATINFDDGFSRTMNSVDALRAFNEIRNTHTVSSTLEWSHLVKFGDRRTPERQDIRIDISDGSDRERVLDLSDSRPNLGRIDLEIHCSERSWADDIERLLTDHFGSKVKSISKFKNFFVENRSVLVIGMMGLMLLFLTFGTYFFVENRNSSEIMQTLLQKNSLEVPSLSDSEKLDVLLKLEMLVLGGNFHLYLPLALLAYFIFFVSAILYGSVIQPSFVVCTEYSHEYRAREARKYKNRNRILVSIISSLTGGTILLVCSYIFSLF